MLSQEYRRPLNFFLSAANLFFFYQFNSWINLIAGIWCGLAFAASFMTPTKPEDQPEDEQEDDNV